MLFALYALAYRDLPAQVVDVIASAPAGIAWLPWSLPAMLIPGGATAIATGAGIALSAVGLTAAGVRLAEHLVRDGLIVGSGAYRGRRGRPPATPSGSRGWFRGIVGRELTLLRRDRNLFVTTLVVPILIIAFQFVINPRLLAGAATDPRHASALAFGIGAYVLIGGGFMVLTTEGKGLWLLYTFPQPIEQVLLRKALVWGGAAAIYTLGVIVAVAAIGPGLDIDFVLGGAMALVGVAIYAIVAAGMGILATDPLEQEIQRKIRPTVLTTYMLLAGMFGYGFYAPISTKIVLVIVCSLLAFAIWQVVRDRAPLLLDPTQSPPPRIALSDGLIAVLAFAVIQSIVAIGGVKAGLPAGHLLVIAFVVAGGAVTVTSLYIFWRRKVPDILATVGIRAPRGAGLSVGQSVVLGVLFGAGASAIALLYLWVVDHIDALRTMTEAAQREGAPMAGVPPVIFATLAVVAAPLFEEFIFRGLVFRGLRRSTHVAAAVVGSAAIFAIVHPPLAVAPVFVLGAATALSFERAGRLIAPICAHAVYNAVLVSAALSA